MHNTFTYDMQAFMKRQVFSDLDGYLCFKVLDDFFLVLYYSVSYKYTHPHN